MAEYSAAFKARVVKQMVGPQAVSATRLAATVGVPQPTLSRWVRAVRSVDVMPRRVQKKWTGAEKLRVVLAAAGLEESALGALLRRDGLQRRSSPRGARLDAPGFVLAQDDGEFLRPLGQGDVEHGPRAAKRPLVEERDAAGAMVCVPRASWRTARV